MTIRELTRRLDEIAWHEQVETELHERAQKARPRSTTTTATTTTNDRVEAELRRLGSEIDAPLLDALEGEAGYLIWALRLAPCVEHGRARERAERYVDSPSWNVREWARAVARRR
jgi:hypothetical protein